MGQAQKGDRDGGDTDGHATGLGAFVGVTHEANTQREHDDRNNPRDAPSGAADQELQDLGENAGTTAPHRNTKHDRASNNA